MARANFIPNVQTNITLDHMKGKVDE